MNCIQLITYFDEYTLEVLLDNFIIKDEGNINNEDNIDIKVINGIKLNSLNKNQIKSQN
jgi:hypothetical protein